MCGVKPKGESVSHAIDNKHQIITQLMSKVFASVLFNVNNISFRVIHDDFSASEIDYLFEFYVKVATTFFGIWRQLLHLLVKNKLSLTPHSKTFEDYTKFY